MSEKAPTCPISHSQDPSNPRGTAPTRLPAIPIATDLPSLIRSVNIMRDILRTLTTSLTINNTYLPRSPRPPKVYGDRNYLISPYPDWYQVEVDNSSGYVGKDPKARTNVERLNTVVFRNNERDDDNLFKWNYKVPLTAEGGDGNEPFEEDFFERIVKVKWKKAGPVKVYTITCSIFPWETVPIISCTYDPFATAYEGPIAGPHSQGEWKYNAFSYPDYTDRVYAGGGFGGGFDLQDRSNYTVSGMPAPGGGLNSDVGYGFNNTDRWRGYVGPNYTGPSIRQSAYYQEFIYQKAPIPYRRLAGIAADQPLSDYPSDKWEEATPMIQINWRGPQFVKTFCLWSQELGHVYTAISTWREYGGTDHSLIKASGSVNFSSVVLTVNEEDGPQTYKCRTVHGHPAIAGSQDAFIRMYCLTDEGAAELEDRWRNK